jgi:hypothetical protein
MSPLFEERDIEVHEQADGHSSQFQVCDQLRLVNRRQLLDNLKLNDHDVVDNQIATKVRLEIVTFVNERHSTIRRDSVPVGFELDDQAGLVDRFEKTWSPEFVLPSPFSFLLSCL